MEAAPDIEQLQRAGKSVSIVIPTYGRDAVLIDTVTRLLALAEPATEIIVVDQCPAHDAASTAQLRQWDAAGTVRWLVLDAPSITRAMNHGLLAARGDVVLYVDDDIIPTSELVREHRLVHDDASLPAAERVVVAGRVLQPWHVDGSRAYDRLASEVPGVVDEFIGCNFSVDRMRAVELGGFDERFVRVAYRYEAEFGARAQRCGYRVRFAPRASIHHLKVAGGGTRSFGDHLRTLGPDHTVGQYYFLLRVRPPGWIRQLLLAPFRAVATRFHLAHPWWIVPMVLAQVLGIVWAIGLVLSGPRLVSNIEGRA